MDAMAALVSSMEKLVTRDVPYVRDTSSPTNHPMLPHPPLPHPPSNICPQPVVTPIQAAPTSQVQYLQYQRPAIPTAATSDLAAPPHPHDNLAVVRIPEGVKQSLCPVGYLNGQMSYVTRSVASSPPLAAAPQLSSSTTKKRRNRSQRYNSQPYVKGPRNPFLPFMKEQQPILAAETDNLISSMIGTLLGERWKVMSNPEQDKYFQESYRLKQLHHQQHLYLLPDITKKPQSDRRPGRLC